ncbi:MAG: hypothetical protein LBP85_03260 [Prevotellaceae bacterium]|nr:hypothetical protein [Prevotellaceae bacterium]
MPLFGFSEVTAKFNRYFGRFSQYFYDKTAKSLGELSSLTNVNLSGLDPGR